MKQQSWNIVEGTIQTNSTDCGLFMLQAIETFLSEDEPDVMGQEL